MEKEEKSDTKIYHNWSYRNKNGANKLIEPHEIYNFGGTNQLYYKEIHTDRIPIHSKSKR